MIERIVNAMAELEDDELYEIVKEEQANGAGKNDIISSLQKGMEIVGQRFSEREYFIGDLVMSAEMFETVNGLFEKDEAGESKYGKFILGTVKDDIHDIGKNIVNTVLTANGFEVIDVGVDAAPEVFVEAIKANPDAKVIGLSCLLTIAFDSLKATVDAIKEAGLAEGRYIIIGGGPCNEKTLAYCGADVLGKDAQDTYVLARDFVTK